VAILINEGSGSASETFAKLMQDNKRATIIGSQSGGAGYYQNTEKISNGGILFYGSKEYISPNGHKIEGVGVTPDIVVPITLSDINQQRDAVLETAKAHLRSR
jgi:carboxyl-terminal processing protease